MNTSTRGLPVKSCAAILVLAQVFSGCSTSQIVQETNNAANKTVFHDKDPKVWERFESAPDLKFPDVNHYIQEIVKRIGRHGRTPGGYEVHVVDDPLVNGMNSLGDISLGRGMLNACQNEAELAAFIGHEIGHQDLPRSSEHKEGVVSSFVRRAVNQAVDYVPDSTGAVQATKGHANDIRETSFSRMDEQAADEYGATLAGKAGYNPYALADLFDRLSARINKNVAYRIAKLKGSHKALDERAKHLRTYLAQKGYKPVGELASERYRSSLAILWRQPGVVAPVVKAPPEAYAALDKFKADIAQYAVAKKPLPFAKFVKMMSQFSVWKKQYGAQPPQATTWLIPGKEDAFMEEAIEQSFPLFGSPGDSAFMSGIDGALNALSHLAIGSFAAGLSPSGLYEAIAGKSFDTGGGLTPGQWGLAALGVLAVGGVAAGVAALGEAFASAEVVDAIGGAAVAAEGEAAIQEASTLAQGLGQDSVLLGENMAERVQPTAGAIGANTYQPTTPSGPNSLTDNQSWLQDNIDAGKTIYDTGIDPGRDFRSPFYDMEQQTMLDNGFEKEFVKEVPIQDADGNEKFIKLYKWRKG